MVTGRSPIDNTMDLALHLAEWQSFEEFEVILRVPAVGRPYVFCAVEQVRCKICLSKTFDI